MRKMYYTKENFGYDTPDNGNQDISRVTTTGKIGLVADATSCSGWDCTIAGQFCPKGVPGASSSSYVCGVPRLELGEWGVGDGLRWISTESRGGRPSYTDINMGNYEGSPGVGFGVEGLPTDKWWVGSAAPYYDYPECHIPYGGDCNYGSNGECCFGASSCVGGTCNTHSNTWNYAHDRRGEDADGCTLQPGSECNYNSGGSGCCKNYIDVGGYNHKCEEGICVQDRSSCSENLDEETFGVTLNLPVLRYDPTSPLYSVEFYVRIKGLSTASFCESVFKRRITHGIKLATSIGISEIDVNILELTDYQAGFEGAIGDGLRVRVKAQGDYPVSIIQAAQNVYGGW